MLYNGVMSGEPIITEDIINVTDENGYTVISYNNDWKTFSESFIDHISECEKFRGIHVGPCPYTFSEIIACGCGRAWKFSKSFIISNQDSRINIFLNNIMDGSLDINQLMDLVRDRKANKIKERILMMIKRLEISKEKINKCKAIKQIKRYRSPISSLDIE